MTDTSPFAMASRTKARVEDVKCKSKATSSRTPPSFTAKDAFSIISVVPINHGGRYRRHSLPGLAGRPWKACVFRRVGNAPRKHGASEGCACKGDRFGGFSQRKRHRRVSTCPVPSWQARRRRHSSCRGPPDAGGCGRRTCRRASRRTQAAGSGRSCRCP